MQLKKELNLLDVFCLASGAMVSSGLFVLPGLAHAQAGPAVVVSYLLAGLLALTGVLSQAELVSAMPKAGGTYFYVTRSMGPMMGTVDGLITWFSLTLKSAFALIGMAAFASLIIPFDIDIRIISVILCLFFVIINLIGAKKASRFQVGLVFGLLAILLVYIARGLPKINVQAFEQFAPGGMSAVFATAGFVFVSFGGLLKVASVAEEVKNPGRVIPLGMILSLTVIMLFYMFTIFVTSGVVPADQLNKSLTPISDGAALFMGEPGRILLSIAAILAFISTANAGIMAASRYPLALSRDGLIPERIGRIHPRFKTPYVATIITGVFMLAALFMKLKHLVEAASSVLILTYMFSCVSVIVLRESRVQNYRPIFRSPLYPWIQILGILGCSLLLFIMGFDAFIACSVVFLCGFVFYWFYGRKKANREYALLHLLERITAKELVSRTLETELKEIIHERDGIVKDSCDLLFERAIVLDIEGEKSIEEFFTVIAKELSKGLELPSDIIRNLLIAREQESSTVISPSVAIPHIVIDGEHKFEVMLVRCKEGIYFSETSPKITTVFILAGTRDERNFHLRVLSATAQIVMASEFDARWLAAKNEEALRDVVLLSQRSRIC